jgi:hypothetical protein
VIEGTSAQHRGNAGEEGGGPPRKDPRPMPRRGSHGIHPSSCTSHLCSTGWCDPVVGIDPDRTRRIPSVPRSQASRVGRGAGPATRRGSADESGRGGFLVHRRPKINPQRRSRVRARDPESELCRSRLHPGAASGATSMKNPNERSPGECPGHGITSVRLDGRAASAHHAHRRDAGAGRSSAASSTSACSAPGRSTPSGRLPGWSRS